jgi:hypothetical protein
VLVFIALNSVNSFGVFMEKFIRLVIWLAMWNMGLLGINYLGLKTTTSMALFAVYAMVVYKIMEWEDSKHG